MPGGASRRESPERLLVPGSAAGLLHSEKAEFHSIADCPIETEIVLIYKENAYFPESVKKFTDYLMTIK